MSTSLVNAFHEQLQLLERQGIDWKINECIVNILFDVDQFIYFQFIYPYNEWQGLATRYPLLCNDYKQAWNLMAYITFFGFQDVFDT